MASTITQSPLPKYTRVNSILNPGSFNGMSWEIAPNVDWSTLPNVAAVFIHKNGVAAGNAWIRAKGDILAPGRYRARAHFREAGGPSPSGLTISVRNNFDAVGPYVAMVRQPDATWYAEWDFEATVQFTSSLLVDFDGVGRGEVIAVQSYALIESASTATTPMLPPFDGGGPNSAGITHQWVSQAFASPSVEFRPDTTAVTAPILVLGYETTWTSGNVMHNVIGKDAPVPTFRRAAARSGTLSLLYSDEGAAQFAAQLHRRPARFALADSERPTLFMVYAVAGSISLRLDPETLTMWILDVDYQEVYPS
jgi:hypothetical protein